MDGQDRRIMYVYWWTLLGGDFHVKNVKVSRNMEKKMIRLLPEQITTTYINLVQHDFNVSSLFIWWRHSEAYIVDGEVQDGKLQERESYTVICRATVAIWLLCGKYTQSKKNSNVLKKRSKGTVHNFHPEHQATYEPHVWTEDTEKAEMYYNYLWCFRN